MMKRHNAFGSGSWWRSGTVVAAALLLASSSAWGQQGYTLVVAETSEEEPAEEATPTIPDATHQQVKVIKPTFGDAKLKLAAFCLTKDGKIVALMNPANQPVAVRRVTTRSTGKATGGLIRALATALSGEAAAKENTADEENGDEIDESTVEAPKALESAAEVRLLDADGKLLAQWPLDFRAEAVNVGVDGNIVLGGDGFVARYDLTGKQLSRADSPQIAGAPKNEQELEDQARETLQAQAVSLEESLKAMEKQKENLNNKKDEDLTEEERTTKQRIDQMIQSYQQAVENYKTPTDQRVKQIVQQLAGRARKTNAIAAGQQHVFVTCSAPKGFGYSVWRTDLDFQNPKMIVSGLSGCCGQMDVQCCEGELIVAENSRKRVVRYDAEGKKVASFGKASRDGAGDTFGSCCNPMNTRLAEGKLYVSDSDGRVRLFTLDGKYEGEVGKAKVRPGCKSSIVDISPDGNRVYYIDVQNSGICVLERKSSGDQQASR